MSTEGKYVIDSKVMDMQRYVAKLNLDGSEGLGVVVPGHILTCAHFAKAVSIDRWSWLEIKGSTSAQEETVFFAQTLDCRLDFMVLGVNPLGQEVDSDSWLEPVEPGIKPVRPVFPDDQAAVTMPVYFFSPDGCTPVFAEATLYRFSPWMLLKHPCPKGCSGGPVFTAGHRLLGIMQGTCQYHGAQPDQAHAIRIDQAASGWLVDELDGLEEWPVQGEVNKVEEICAS